jgi:hypothetical protein
LVYATAISYASSFFPSFFFCAAASFASLDAPAPAGFSATSSFFIAVKSTTRICATAPSAAFTCASCNDSSRDLISAPVRKAVVALDVAWIAAGVDEETRDSSMRMWRVGASGEGRRRMETARIRVSIGCHLFREILTIILALHTGHNFLHQILTGHSQFLEVQEFSNRSGRCLGVFLGDHENGGRDGGLGCLGLEEELGR